MGSDPGPPPPPFPPGAPPPGLPGMQMLVLLPCIFLSTPALCPPIHAAVRPFLHPSLKYVTARLFKPPSPACSNLHPPVPTSIPQGHLCVCLSIPTSTLPTHLCPFNLHPSSMHLPVHSYLHACMLCTTQAFVKNTPFTEGKHMHVNARSHVRAHALMHARIHKSAHAHPHMHTHIYTHPTGSMSGPPPGHPPVLRPPGTCTCLPFCVHTSPTAVLLSDPLPFIVRTIAVRISPS